MILKRIEPISCAKIYAVICLMIGFVSGIVIALIAWAMHRIAPPPPDVYSDGLGFLFGTGAVIAYPIFYGILGFVFGFLTAVVYNWLAGMIGGIELEFE